MPRSVRLYLNDILKAIQRINDYVGDITAEAFRADELRTDGILFNLMTIGEAAKHIPPDIRALSPEITWREIGRFRDFVVHHYFSLDMNEIWDIVHVDLPPLKVAVEKLLHDLQEDENSKD
jgi:uncharacterized protein with HEPN domain